MHRLILRKLLAARQICTPEQQAKYVEEVKKFCRENKLDTVLEMIEDDLEGLLKELDRFENG